MNNKRNIVHVSLAHSSNSVYVTGSRSVTEALEVEGSSTCQTRSCAPEHTKTSACKSETGIVSPVGRLKASINKCREITDDSYILKVVEDGYKLLFKSVPSSVCIKNNSARDNPEFVKEEIGRLLQRGVISQLEAPPHVVNPLTVAYGRSGKPRLVLDCRHINPSLHLFKGKFEDISTALIMSDESTYVFSFVLKSAYHHIDIFEGHRTFLGFSWQYDSVSQYFIYNSLPFGISVAGHILTKTLKCVVKFLRWNGHRIIIFLDDGIGGRVECSEALKSSHFVKQTLLDLGFLIAEEKCNWAPNQSASWLRHTIDYVSNRLHISEERVCRLRCTLESLLYECQRDKLPVVPVRYLA